MLLPETAKSTPHKSSAAVERRPASFSLLAPALAALALAASPIAILAQRPANTPVLLDAMNAELHRAFTSLGKSGATADASSARDDKQPPYFISYSVHDTNSVTISAQYGALTMSGASHERTADVQVRVGSPKLDNTHGEHRSSAVNSMPLPLGDDREAIERTLWLATNKGYGNALDNYLRVKTEAQVRAKEEDTSPDFSQEAPQAHLEKPAPPLEVRKAEWEERVRALSRIFREFPDVYQNQVGFEAESSTHYFVSSEDAKVVTPYVTSEFVIVAATRADDGMDMFLARTFQAATPQGLPAQADLEKAVREVGARLEALRKAPVTEPFDGPAILSGRAAAVFFHEVLGHRLEGQRQRGDEEGQTFTKDLDKEILPPFLSVADDPTIANFDGIALAGHYEYDSEGEKAERVELIQDGVLKTFLMSRLPIASFSASNGHGRAQAGFVPTGRQGNLIVTSTKSVSDAELRKQLIDEAKRQGKSYGLYFEDISSGFAVTQRRSPQAFQVIPLVVWRVYVDGRPDELVRGVSIVGTPLAAMKKILVTGDTSEVFDGVCGAESGSIPVSAVAPAMLVSEIETQRQAQGTARPPILPIPGADATKEAK
ncbi:MAG: metallopeptidase TldD-related protein [Terracidiphilus sp.]|jgi:predicted Zn-dependent protease